MKNRFDQPLNELEGYLKLGMAEETLTVANTIFKRRTISAGAFVEAVEAVLIQADHLKSWRRRIEVAYETLPQEQKLEAATKMFHFYVAIEDWREAVSFMPKRAANPATLVFSMWTLLELKELERAKSIQRKCAALLRLHGLKRIELDEFSLSCILEALGSYYAQTGDWDSAEAAWEAGGDFSSFAESAWDGLVKLHAYRGLLQANVASESAKENVFSDDDGLMLPGNSASRCAHVDKQFHSYAKHLAKVIPAKDRWRFGR